MMKLKKSLLLALTLALLLSFGTMQAFAEEAAEQTAAPEAASPEATRILQSAQVMQTETVPLQVVEDSLGITAVVRNYEELKAALLSDNVIGAYLFSDIELEARLYIFKDFTFDAVFGETTIYSAPGERHFAVLEDDAVIDFGGVILDGRNSRGGIDVHTSNTLKNGVVQNCVSQSDYDAGISADKSLSLIDFTVQNCSDMGIYVRYDLDMEDCTVRNNGSVGIWPGNVTMTGGLVTENAGGFSVRGNMTMHSGTISNNTSDMNGSGVHLDGNGTFIMYDGEITGNVTLGRGIPGGGLSAGTIEIHGGLIDGNECGSAGGGGVLVGNSLTMTGGTISNNINGGVQLFSMGAKMLMTGGVIENNTAEFGAGITAFGDVEMTGGIIRGNSASRNGGAIFAQDSSKITITGGEIIGNSAVNGGGIFTNGIPSINVKIGEDVVFSENTAANGYYMTDPDDIATHNQLIQTRHFSAPFTQYAYNNYDIGYTKGVNIDDAVVVSFYLTKSTGEIYHTTYAAPGAALDELPESPSMDGFQFVGWYDSEGNLFDSAQVITQNTDLYAAWIIL